MVFNKFEAERKLRDEFAELFGENLNVRQLWAITKLAKMVRLRARNNNAFNPLMERLFPGSRFQTVTKTHADGSTYPGLRITLKGETSDGDGEDE